MKISRRAILLAVTPNILLLILYYSLAIHMYLSLGGWPTAIGERGFPAPLVVHGYITMSFFIALIWFGIFIWPVAMLLGLLVRRWRRHVPYLALYAVLFGFCWALMQLAPDAFLYWWRD